MTRTFNPREDYDQDGALDLLAKLLEQSAYQTGLLARVASYLKIANCQLDAIHKQSCHARNELHWQTDIQDGLATDVAALLELTRTATPAASLQLDRIHEMRNEIAACCDTTDVRHPICEFESCLSTEEDEKGSRETKEGSAPPKRVKDAPYKPVERPDRPATQPNTRPVRTVPDGLLRGVITESPGTGPQVMGSAADDPVVFGVYTSDPTVAPASTNAADMSGAQAEGVVMMSGNWYLDFSVDGGATFTTLDPTTVFPETLAGGFCCDQVIQYVPEIDRFLWLLQYSQGGGGANAYRVAAASPQDVIDSGCTAWTYWDLSSASFGIGTDWMDYPSLAIGDDFAYVSFDVLDTVADGVADNGLVVVRIPLDEIAAETSINFRFTNPADSAVAWGSNVSQNTGDEVFWAGHIDNSTMRVFNWPESSTGYAWRSVGVSNWPNATLTSAGPNANNWFGWGFPNNAIIGITRRRNELWLAWTASNGQGSGSGFQFPHPHVQVVKVDVDNYSVIEQTQVWNPDHAFGYPSFATNSQDEVGIALGWGGGGAFDMNTAVGIMGDFVVWYRDSSDWTHTRSGDYVTVRRAGSDPRFFAGFGYFIVQDAAVGVGYRFEPYYTLFGRETQIIE